MKTILIIGASSGTGREAVKQCLAQGLKVTAFARSAEQLPEQAGLTRMKGDVLKPQDVDAAVQGHDAVIVTLGIHENPILVRLGIRKTPIDVRSQGTKNVIAAMQKHGVRRLLVQSTYGIGASKGRLPASWALIFALLLKPQIDDSERQEEVVRASELDWTLIQPVGLTDKNSAQPAFTSLQAETKAMQVSRKQVAEVLLSSVTRSSDIHGCIAVSS